MTIKAISNVSNLTNLRHIQKKIIQRGKEITSLKDMKSIAYCVNGGGKPYSGTGPDTDPH